MEWKCSGLLFLVQDECIRRLFPLECKRLMGFPDNYTNLVASKKINRYQAIGNSWAIPVIQWLGKHILDYSHDLVEIDKQSSFIYSQSVSASKQGHFFDFGKDIIELLNCTATSEMCSFKEISSIVSPDASEDIYISPVSCYGIISRKKERNLKINLRLKEVILSISSKMSA